MNADGRETADSQIIVIVWTEVIELLLHRFSSYFVSIIFNGNTIIVIFFNLSVFDSHPRFSNMNLAHSSTNIEIYFHYRMSANKNGL